MSVSGNHIIAFSGGLAVAFLLSATGATAMVGKVDAKPLPPSTPLPQRITIKRTIKQQAAHLVAQYDQNTFGGFYSTGGRSHADVLAMFQIESNFTPGAINENDGGTLPDGSGNHAMGIGQVLITTAGDYGITNPNDLLDLEIGALVAMKHLKWSFDFLAGRLGRSPSQDQWIGSYQAGVGNALKGKISDIYVNKHRAAKAIIQGSNLT